MAFYKGKPMNALKDEKTRRIFEEYSVPRALLAMAVPTVIGQLIILIYNLADTFFIGRTDNPYMVGAAALILPVYNICISIANIAGTGGGSLISRLIGTGQTEKAGKVSSFSFYFTIFATAAFSLGFYFFIDDILLLLGASRETFAYARSYSFFVIVLGGVPTVLSMTLSNLIRSAGYSKEAGFGVSMGGVLNILLDPLFMFFLLPEGMEITGAAIATMLSNLLSCLYFLLFYYKKRKESVLTLSVQSLPGRHELIGFFAVGIPAAIGTLLFDLAYILIDKLASVYGDIPLAAVGIVLKAERLPLNVGVGICLGMVPLLSYSYSSGKTERLRKIISFSRLVGIIIAAVSVSAYEILAPRILQIFIHNEETVAIGTSFLRARCLATPFMFLCFHTVHFFQSVGEGKISLGLIVCRWVVLDIPALLLLEKAFGMYGIVWAQLAGDGIMAVLSLILYFVYVRKNFGKENILNSEK